MQIQRPNQSAECKLSSNYSAISVFIASQQCSLVRARRLARNLFAKGVATLISDVHITPSTSPRPLLPGPGSLESRLVKSLGVTSWPSRAEPIQHSPPTLGIRPCWEVEVVNNPRSREGLFCFSFFRSLKLQYLLEQFRQQRSIFIRVGRLGLEQARQPPSSETRLFLSALS